MHWLLQSLRRAATKAGARAHPVDGGCVVAPSPGALPAYVARGHWALAAPELDSSLELLIAQLAAELSGCRWCIEQGWHRWRKAYLPAEVLRALQDYRVNPLYSDRDRAALALAEAVVRYSEREPTAAEAILATARGVFTEVEVARMIQIAAREHFFNPVNGAIGLDAVESLELPRELERPPVGL